MALGQSVASLGNILGGALGGSGGGSPLLNGQLINSDTALAAVRGF